MPDTGLVPAAAVATVEPPCIGFPLSSVVDIMEPIEIVEKWNQ
jgi:hypothetical protein